MGKITRKNLEKWDKEDLINMLLVRNDDASDFSKALTIKENEVERLKKKCLSLKEQFKEGLEDLKSGRVRRVA